MVSGFVSHFDVVVLTAVCQ